MNDEAKANPDPRRCTCHPAERPAVCQHKYASRDCQIAAVAARLRFFADGVPEIANELRTEAGILERLV
jgi:hypothetical protein